MKLGRFWLALKLALVGLALMTLLRAIFFMIYFDHFSSLTFFEILFSFLNGIRFDISILLTFIGFSLLMITLPLQSLGSRWIHFWSYTVLLISMMVLLVISGDIVYFDLVKRHLSNEILLLQGDMAYIVEMASHYLGSLFLFLFFMIMVWLGFNYLIQKSRLEKSSWVAPLLLITIVILGMRGNLSAGKPINVIDAYGSGKNAMGNLALNGCFTAYHFSRASGKFQSPKFYELQELYKNLDLVKDQNKTYLFSQQATPSQSKAKNIVFILLESWSAKYIGALGSTYGVTPNFDALSKEGTLYTNFYASGQRSIQGIQAVLTSIPPFSGLPSLGFGLEVYGHSRVADMAREEGYETLFVQSSNRRSFRMDAIASSLGFENYYGKEDIPLRLDYEVSTPKFGWDYETLMFVFDKLESAKKPFFSFTFTGTTHVPYTKVPQTQMRYKHEPLGENGFLNTLSYADWALGEFMKKAKKAPWFKDTVFIFTADHALGSFSKGGFKEKFHTPLLIIDGEKLTEKRVSTVASQLDLMPTMVELIGYDQNFTAFGQRLSANKSFDALVSESSSIGLITKEGFLRHSLRDRLESSLEGEMMEEKERKLLSSYQIVNTLLKENRWAKK